MVTESHFTSANDFNDLHPLLDIFLSTRSEGLQRIQTGSCFDQHLRMIIILKSKSQSTSQTRTIYIGNLHSTRL